MLGLWLGLSALPAIAWAQKGQLKGSSDSGKSAMKPDDSPKSWGSGNSGSSPSNSSPSNSSYNSEPSRNYSSDSYSSPSNSASEESEPKPRRRHEAATESSPSESVSTWSSPSPATPKPTESKPTTSSRPYFASPNWSGSAPDSRGNTASPTSNGAAEQSTGGRTVVFDAEGPRQVRVNNDPLPGTRPDPLPPPPGGWAPLTASGSVGAIDAPQPDTARPSVGYFGGTVLSAPPRPQFSRDTLPNNTLSQPVKPKGGLQPRPVPAPALGGGGSDPYGQYTNLQINFAFNMFGDGGFAYSGLPPALACIYGAADQLEALYLSPRWCVTEFVDGYGSLLGEFRRCYRDLPRQLEEDWMQPALLTYQDEMNFWAEECANGNPELQAIRDYLRAKAAFVPYLMPEVDAKLTEDWTYIDTAFAAPLGGYNYYRTVQAYDPQGVVKQLNVWANRFESIRNWPSYARVAGFHVQYFRSAFWALLRNKASGDFDQATAWIGQDEEKGYKLAENAGWLCAAMLAVEPKEKEMTLLRDQVKALLKSRPGRWADHPLAKALD